MAKSAFDVLVENLKEMGFEPKTHHNAKDLFLRDRSQAVFSKSVGLELDGCYFFASEAHSSTSTGIYSRIEGPEEMQCSIYKKDWFDRFFVSGKKKTGVESIDRKLTITSAAWLPTGLLTAENVDSFLTLYARVRPVKLFIRNDYLPNLVPLKGEKVIGIETNRFLYRKFELEPLLQEGVALVNGLKAGI